MEKKSFRVFFTRLDGGGVTGTLLRTWQWFFDKPAPSAHGPDETDVFEQLEVLAHALVGTEGDDIARYLWSDTFSSQMVTLHVRPQTSVQKRMVIGANAIPISMTYLWSRLPDGGYRVMVPRFGWSFILQDLAGAREILQQTVGSFLLGENPRSIFDFRMGTDEWVRDWRPRLLQSREVTSRDDDQDDREVLRTVADELVDRASRGKLPSVIGDSPELDAAMPWVARDPPASLLVVGPPGVGKTAWVHRLARRLLALRRNKTGALEPRLWSTSAERVLAGMVYLGMWQERCFRIVSELEYTGDYLHFDRIGPLLRPQSDGSSLGELFIEPMRSEAVSLIVECTEPELEMWQRKAGAFMSRFRIVRLPEPATADTIRFLADYEQRKGGVVQLHPAARKRLVQHLSLFRRDQAFPGKAARFFDWLCQGADQAKPRTLYPRDISNAYARHSGIPLRMIADDVPSPASEIATSLKLRVIGQDHACDALASVLARFKAGMNDPERPCGTLLLVGPTGVGKTQLCKEVARTMFGDVRRMVRLDMSEYQLPWSVARMIDVGRGVQSLAQRVREQPLSLVLFDEVEKADDAVFDLLLGILGEGRLTDVEGRLVDFRMTLVMMTSNLGVAERTAVGFGERDSSGSERAVRDFFRPEFFNRLDQVVSFRPLSATHVWAIVDLELASLATRDGLVQRGISLEVDDAARDCLATLGFDPARGARPLKRVIEELVVTPLAARLAAHPTLANVVIHVTESGGRILVV